MNTQVEDSKKFLTPKTFEGDFRCSGHSVHVTVETPELCDNPSTLWGDWGPMHEVELKPDQLVKLTFECPQTGAQVTHTFSPPKIGLHSPARLKERRRCPYYLEVVDPSHGVAIQAFMNGEAEVEECRVAPVLPGQDIFALLFRATAA